MSICKEGERPEQEQGMGKGQGKRARTRANPQPRGRARPSPRPSPRGSARGTKGKGKGKGMAKGKAKGKENRLKCGGTRHKEYSRVYHSVYALALQEGETSERAKFRARLVAKEHVAFK